MEDGRQGLDDSVAAGAPACGKWATEEAEVDVCPADRDDRAPIVTVLLAAGVALVGKGYTDPSDDVRGGTSPDVVALKLSRWRPPRKRCCPLAFPKVAGEPRVHEPGHEQDRADGHERESPGK